jgi:hypothetical protein
MRSVPPSFSRRFRPGTYPPGSRRSLTALIAAGQVLSSLFVAAQNLPAPTAPVPTPVGWYDLFERGDFVGRWLRNERTQIWSKPQIDHDFDKPSKSSGKPSLQDVEGTYWQQGSYCQWAAPGNRTNATHRGASPPASVHFKFELVPLGHDAHDRTNLQIHPDGAPAGTAGCVGIQSYEHCCRALFLLRHHSNTRILVSNN